MSPNVSKCLQNVSKCLQMSQSRHFPPTGYTNLKFLTPSLTKTTIYVTRLRLSVFSRKCYVSDWDVWNYFLRMRYLYNSENEPDDILSQLFKNIYVPNKFFLCVSRTALEHARKVNEELRQRLGKYEEVSSFKVHWKKKFLLQKRKNKNKLFSSFQQKSTKTQMAFNKMQIREMQKKTKKNFYISIKIKK